VAEIEQALYTRLTGFAGLSALVASRVYPMRLPQSPTYPAVTYQRVAGERTPAMGADTGVMAAVVQLDAWGATYPSAKAVAKQVRLALERHRNGSSDPEILDIFIERDQDLDPAEEPVPDLFRVSLDFRVWHREALS